MEFAKYIIYLIDAEIILIPRKLAFIRIIQFSKFLKINNRTIKNHLVRYLQRAQKEKKSILRVLWRAEAWSSVSHDKACIKSLNLIPLDMGADTRNTLSNLDSIFENNLRQYVQILKVYSSLWKVY